MALVFKREKRKILNPKLLLVALVVLILIPLSSTANSLTREECLLVVNEGNVLYSVGNMDEDKVLIIAHDTYFYKVILHTTNYFAVKCEARGRQAVWFVD